MFWFSDQSDTNNLSKTKSTHIFEGGSTRRHLVFTFSSKKLLCTNECGPYYQSHTKERLFICIPFVWLAWLKVVEGGSVSILPLWFGLLALALLLPVDSYLGQVDSFRQSSIHFPTCCTRYRKQK